MSAGTMTMAQTLTFRTKVHFGRAEKGTLELREGEAQEAVPVRTGRVPKISRLMALAIRFDGMLARGEVKDYAELARLGHVTRARVTQVMNLLNLAPDIQEQILFLPEVEAGRDPLKEWQVRPVAAEADWSKQRRAWRELRAPDGQHRTGCPVLVRRAPGKTWAEGGSTSP